MRFDGVKDDKLLRILHEIIVEDKGKELALGHFKSPPPVNIEDVEVSPLHVTFNLKRVLVGKEYFRINYLWPPLFNLDQGCTLLGKNIVPSLALKKFLLRCLECYHLHMDI